ncbi:MAG: MFS transporter [Verrucomicrobiota bacterium]
MPEPDPDLEGPEIPDNEEVVDPAFARNPKLFLLFRVFFNARFYYPVYALMFLDFGLSQEQFATLNLAWALSIVLLEVPSGALADQVGRLPLIIAASLLMILEMVVMLLMPVAFDAPAETREAAISLLFIVFLINRVISGAAEAAASGADEALAYDSLAPSRRDELWSQLTSKLMRWQSIGFILVTLIGAAIYDPAFVNRALGWVGIESDLSQSLTLKFPIALTLGMAIGVLIIALQMREPPSGLEQEGRSLGEALADSFRRTLSAGRWIMMTPAALMLLLIGLFFDSIIRLFYTVGSIWLEVIGYEPAQLGLISVAGSAAGILAAMLGEHLIRRFGPGFNFRFLSILVFIGVLSLAFPIQYWSVMFLPTLWIGMRLLHYFLSNYLNRVTNAENRATVLSFRGLSMNLSYGLLTWLYGKQTYYLREGRELDGSEDPDVVTHEIFAEAVSTWWIYFAVVLVGLVAFRLLVIRKGWNELLPSPDSRETG